MEQNLYKLALKENYLYRTNRGAIATEDLFDIPLSGNNGFNLDQIAKNIAHDIKQDGEESFVSATIVNPTNENKLAIVKDIIHDKLVAKEEKANAKEKAAKKQKLLEILARKQDLSLEAKTEAEILAELEALEG
jgi:hypothetical protein